MYLIFHVIHQKTKDSSEISNIIFQEKDEEMSQLQLYNWYFNC